jgi:hypothetical protein
MECILGPVSKRVAVQIPKLCLEENAEQVPRRLCFAACLVLLLSFVSFSAARAEATHPPSPTITVANESSPSIAPQLIVIGFMGGRVSGGNLIHKEAQLAKELQQNHPLGIHAAVFANHDAQDALKLVLHLLDRNQDGHLSTDEKNSARIVIYGHSWGASETVAFARQLNALGIPVLLTIQVDSVQKLNEDDTDIPPNVREAINFYQTEGLLHGRPLIVAMDPKRTTILGNFASSYKINPVSCTDYPWMAQGFHEAAY